MTVLALLDPNTWGTVADWVVGAVFGVATAALAGVAAYWSRRAAKATERQALLAALTQHVQFELTCQRTGTSTDMETYVLTLTLSDDSVPVWLRQVEILVRGWLGAFPGQVPTSGQTEATKQWFSDFRQAFPYQPGGIHVSPGTTQTRSLDLPKYEGRGLLDLDPGSWGAKAVVRYSLESENDLQEALQSRVIDMTMLPPNG